MSENNESRCWDCPERWGLSKLSGKLALKFYKNGDFTSKKVKENRGDCPGPVPAPFFTQRSYSTIEEGDTATHQVVRHDTYIRVCPQNLDEVSETPVEIRTTMALNDLDVFTVEAVETLRAEPLADHQARRAEIRARYEARCHHIAGPAAGL